MARRLDVGIRLVWLAALLLPLACKRGPGETCKHDPRCGVDGTAPCRDRANCKEGLRCVQGECLYCRDVGMRPPDDSYWRKGKTCFVDPSKIEQKEGCPCGCDHSEAMVKELAAIGPDERRRRIDRSLAQIAEREGAGYITEDMVRHRLRLSSLRSSLKAPGEPTPAAPRPLALTPTCGRDVCVAAELVAHADNHVVIRDRPKHLRACHVLRVEVTNRSGDDRQIVAQFGLPVARWYRAGTAGAPWDGGLAAGESASLVAIGYTAPLQPHEDVRTTVQIDDVAIPVSTRARARWDQPE